MSLEFLVITGPDKGRSFVLNVGQSLMLGRDAGWNRALRSN
jgi:hypothetical protein